MTSPFRAARRGTFQKRVGDRVSLRAQPVIRKDRRTRVKAAGKNTKWNGKPLESPRDLRPPLRPPVGIRRRLLRTPFNLNERFEKRIFLLKFNFGSPGVPSLSREPPQDGGMGAGGYQIRAADRLARPDQPLQGIGLTAASQRTVKTGQQASDAILYA